MKCMIEDYNSKYVILSANRWMFYTNGLTLNVELMWDSKNKK